MSVNLGVKNLVNKALRALFTNFLTPVLTRKFFNLLDDWLESTNLTNHTADYKIRELTQELKVW